jgi:hypothetical protein
MKAVKDLERVVGTAVERNSWGKSRGGLMCRFPNTGGLHHTSGNAPLDTRIMSNNSKKHGIQPVTKLTSTKSFIMPGTTIVMSNNGDKLGIQPGTNLTYATKSMDTTGTTIAPIIREFAPTT